MIHLYDRETMVLALASDLDPKLKSLLAARIGALGEELIDETEYLVVQPGDTEHDIVRHIGLSPLVEPIDGHRWGTPGFWPHWDLLLRHEQLWEMVITFGSSFAYVLLIPEQNGVDPALIALCREYAA